MIQVEEPGNKPTGIQWNERGILNTAHMLTNGEHLKNYGKTLGKSGEQWEHWGILYGNMEQNMCRNRRQCCVFQEG